MRIMNFYAYIDYMKKRVSLTIDKTIYLEPSNMHWKITLRYQKWPKII